MTPSSNGSRSWTVITFGTLTDPTWTSVYKLRCSADRGRVVVDVVILVALPDQPGIYSTAN